MDGKPLRVLFVNDHLGFSDGMIHGVARYFLNVLPRFNRSAVNPTLCILRDWHPFAEQLDAVGVKPVFLNRQKWDLRALIDLIQLVQKLEIDVLHLAGMKGCLLGRIASRITNRPSVIHISDMYPMGLGLRFFQRKLARWTDLALAISEPVRELIIQEFKIPNERVAVLHNSLDISAFANPTSDARERIRSEFGIKPQARVIGIIGRLSPEKGHNLLIRAMPLLLVRCPDVILLVVGDGPTRTDCESLVQALSLQDVVRFTGYRSDIADVLAAVNAVVMPSTTEALGFAALEAIAAGKPVVASRVGGLPEIVIEGETGFLVTPGNTEELVRALLEVLGNTELAVRLSQTCRRHSERFTVERHTRCLEEIYKTLVRPDSPASALPRPARP